MSWRHNEEWRWDPQYHAPPRAATISVIERTKEDEAAATKRDEGKRRVPFGFARVLQPDPEPLSQATWEGDGA